MQIYSDGCSIHGHSKKFLQLSVCVSQRSNFIPWLQNSQVTQTWAFAIIIGAQAGHNFNPASVSPVYAITCVCYYTQLFFSFIAFTLAFFIYLKQKKIFLLCIYSSFMDLCFKILTI